MVCKEICLRKSVVKSSRDLPVHNFFACACHIAMLSAGVEGRSRYVDQVSEFSKTFKQEVLTFQNPSGDKILRSESDTASHQLLNFHYVTLPQHLLLNHRCLCRCKRAWMNILGGDSRNGHEFSRVT